MARNEKKRMTTQNRQKSDAKKPYNDSQRTMIAA